MRVIRGGRRRSGRGQSLVEFALVIPIFMALLLGVLQFGMILWSQVTLAQVARDGGRWAASQATVDESAIRTQINTLAGRSVLFGYSAGNPVTTSASPSSAVPPCPPTSNASVCYVNINVQYRVPTFLPGIPVWTISTSVQYRLEPRP